MADRSKQLEALIAKAEPVLLEAEKQRFFISDPLRRRRMESEIQRLQKQLFQHRKELAALRDPDPALPNPAHTRESTHPRVFISYNRADQDWVKRLLVHLKPLKRDGIDIWDDTKVEARARWRDEIESALKAAKVAVLLVSADYLASNFVADNELPFLLQAAVEHGTHVLPVIVSPCAFERTVLGRFQAVNSPSSPLTRKSRQEQERTLAQVAEAVQNTLASPLPSGGIQE